MGDHFVGMTCEVTQEFELLWGKSHFTTPHGHQPRRIIDVEVTDVYLSHLFGWSRHAGSSQACTDASKEFIHVEGLGYVVVRASVQCFHLDLFFTSNRKH